MDVIINYWWAGVCLVLLIILLIWLIKRNRKDEKVFEKDFMQAEIKPEKHDDKQDKEIKP
jgi:hypothetical protein